MRQRSYEAIPTGAYHGSVDLRWVAPDKFLYIPNETDPFYFQRANGEIIKPGLIYTDGGTIPRALWRRPVNSPWGYAPAYLIHDWIVDREVESLTRAEIQRADQILAEGIKTLMEAENDIDPDPSALRRVQRTISSRVAKRNGKEIPWHNHLPSPEDAVERKSVFLPEVEE
ncbi:MAG: DUF1353 domain-containing protein [Verrucomicrobiota bacterium]